MCQREDVPEEGVAGANKPVSDERHRGNYYYEELVKSRMKTLQPQGPAAKIDDEI